MEYQFARFQNTVCNFVETSDLKKVNIVILSPIMQPEKFIFFNTKTVIIIYNICIAPYNTIF